MNEEVAEWIMAHRNRGIGFLVDIFGLHAEDAEDAFGQLVLRWLEKPPRFVTQKYLLQGCYFAGRDFLRSHARDRGIIELDAMPEESCPGETARESSTTDEQDRHIASLEPLTKRAVVLVSEGHTREEAAELLNVPASTVRRWFCVLREEIRKECA